MKEHAAGIPLDFTQLHPTYGPGQNSPTDLANWRATHMLQGLGRTALFSNSPYVNNALETIVTHGGGSPDSPPKRRGKVRSLGSKQAAIRRAQMALSSTTPFLPQVPFADALRVACMYNDRSAVPPLIDAYILSRPRLPVDILDSYTQVLAVQLPATQLQAVQILVQNGYYFTAIKSIFEDKQALQATLEEIELIITQQLINPETGDAVWNWKEADKELLVHQFSNLRIIGYYCDLRQHLHMLHHGQVMAALAKVEQEMLIKVVRDFKAQVGHELALIVIEKERLSADASLAAQSSVISTRSNRSYRTGSIKSPKSPTAASPAKKQAVSNTSPTKASPGKPDSTQAPTIADVTIPTSNVNPNGNEAAVQLVTGALPHSTAAVQLEASTGQAVLPHLESIAEDAQKEQEETTAVTASKSAQTGATQEGDEKHTSDAADVAAVVDALINDTAQETQQPEQQHVADASSPSPEETQQQASIPAEESEAVHAEPSLSVPQQQQEGVTAPAGETAVVSQESSVPGQPAAEPTLSDLAVVTAAADAGAAADIAAPESTPPVEVVPETGDTSAPAETTAAGGESESESASASQPTPHDGATEPQPAEGSSTAIDQPTAAPSEAAANVSSVAAQADAPQPAETPAAVAQECATVHEPAAEKAPADSDMPAAPEASASTGPQVGDVQQAASSDTPEPAAAVQEAVAAAAGGAQPSEGVGDDEVASRPCRPMSRVSATSSTMSKVS